MKIGWIALLIIVIGLSACVQVAQTTATPQVTGVGVGQVTIEAKLTPTQPVATSPSSLVTSTPSVSSGIVGNVTIGPTCPGPVRIGDTGCQDKPYQAKITILDSDQSEIITILTDEQGFFQIPLKPGEYILRPEPGKPLPVAPEQTVVVADRQFTQVMILYDSGMR